MEDNNKRERKIRNGKWREKLRDGIRCGRIDNKIEGKRKGK